jgi:ABC-type transporter MlaC component
MMSVGLFYLPAAMLSIAAAAATPEPPSVVRRRAAMATSAVTSVLRLDADEQRRLLHRAAADGVSLQEAARAAVRAYVDG